MHHEKARMDIEQRWRRRTPDLNHRCNPAAPAHRTVRHIRDDSVVPNLTVRAAGAAINTIKVRFVGFRAGARRRRNEIIYHSERRPGILPSDVAAWGKFN